MGLETAAAISLGLAAVGTGASVIQGIKGSNAKAKADAAAVSAANDLQRVLEQNRFEALKVPSLGLDLAQQNMQAWQQSQIQALRDAGAAGVLGGVTAAGRQAQEQNLQLAGEANKMQAQRDQMLAQNAQQIESNRVQRQAGLAQQRLEGAQRASAIGQGQIDTAIQGGIGNLQNAAFSYQYFNKGKTPTDVNKTNDLSGLRAAQGDYEKFLQNKQTGQNVMNAAQAAALYTLSPGSNFNQFAPQINNNPVDLSGLRAAQGQYESSLNQGGQTGDALNDMYYRNAQLGK